MNNVKKAASTSRDNGAVGKNPMVYAYVKEQILNGKSKTAKFLDFGAGKTAKHTLELRKEGLDVTAYDLPINMKVGLHKPDALDYQYDVVMASNVLNVWSNKEDVENIIQQLVKVTKSTGCLICNFPKDPRYSGLDNQEFIEIISKYFDQVNVVKGKSSGKNSVLLLCNFNDTCW